MAAYGNVDLHTRLHMIAQYLDYRTHCLAALRRVGGYLGDDELAVLRAAILFLRDHNLVAIPAIVRNHDTKALLPVITPYYLLAAAL